MYFSFVLLLSWEFVDGEENGLLYAPISRFRNAVETQHDPKEKHADFEIYDRQHSKALWVLSRSTAEKVSISLRNRMAAIMGR